MKQATIDNSIDTEIKRSILWQYDYAYNLIGVLNILKDFFTQSTKDFWDDNINNIIITNPDTVTTYALTVWGKLLQVPWITINNNGTKSKISNKLYCKILKARFQLMMSNASVTAYLNFLKTVFSSVVTREDVESTVYNVTIADESGMALTLAWQTTGELTNEQTEQKLLFNQALDLVMPYPVGVKSHDEDDGPVFGFAEQTQYKDEDGDEKYIIRYKRRITLTNSGTSEITIASGAYFTEDGINYATESSTTISAGGSTVKPFYTPKGTGTGYCGSVDSDIGTLYYKNGTAVSNVTGVQKVQGFAIQSEDYISSTDYQYVSTSVIVTITNTSLSSITIAVGGATYNNGTSESPKRYANISEVTIDAGKSADVLLAYAGADYVEQRAITSVGVSDTTVTNKYRSHTDFKIGNLKDDQTNENASTISWNRFNDR